jgi:uroporphyrinogen decarboxylase
MAYSGADIIDVDWMVDIHQAAEIFADKAALCGNFDPVAVILQGTPQTVYAATRECIQKGGQRLFSGAGCEIPDRTPPENLLAQYSALCQ